MSRPIPSPKSSKTEWRDWAFVARKSLAFGPLSEQLCAQLTQAVATAENILLYAGTQEELDVLSLVRDPGKFYLPRCAPKRRLAVHAYPCPLVVSRFGIFEPDASLPEVPPEMLDLVIVPALVLDKRGFRLGYGGGYYDRFLPRLRPDCRTIGVAPFLVDTLPTDSWDIPVRDIWGMRTGP